MSWHSCVACLSPSINEWAELACRSVIGAHTHNNSPFPYEERGAGGLQFASPLPQSLAFSRAFLIQRKHPRQNKTSAICSTSPYFPPQSRWLSTGACSASVDHWSISASNRNINCVNLETFDKLQASCFALVSVACLFSVHMIHWHFMQNNIFWNTMYNYVLCNTLNAGLYPPLFAEIPWWYLLHWVEWQCALWRLIFFLFFIISSFLGAVGADRHPWPKDIQKQ